MPASSIVLAENGTVVELSREGVRVVDEIETGVAFVDGLHVALIAGAALAAVGAVASARLLGVSRGSGSPVPQAA